MLIPFMNKNFLEFVILGQFKHTRVVPESRRLFMFQENYTVYCNQILLVNSSIISALSGTV